MALVPGILFEAVEPPNPWLRLPPSVHDHAHAFSLTAHTPHIPQIPTGAFFTTNRPVKSRNVPIPPQDEQVPNMVHQEKKQALLPPFSISLEISVTQGMAKAAVTQTFRNDSAETIDKGIYQFPLPHDSSIVDFKCQIGTDKTMQGVVKPKSDAREEFENALSKGSSAGLVEQNSPEVFKTEIGNIPPHTTVEVKIAFIFLLKYRLQDEATTTILTLPTYIAPRYGNPGFDLGQTGPLDTKLSLDIDILAGNKIRRIESDTHQVVVERGIRRRYCQRWADFVADPPSDQSASASVKLDGENAYLDKDFVLLISAHPTIHEELPHATLEIHPDIKGSSAMMIDIPPSFMLRDQAPLDDTEVIFLADRSGSMRDKIAGLMSSMQFFLRGLPKTRFNLYSFGSHYHSLWRTSQPYGDDTLDEALKYVAGFSNDMGGTEILPALEAVVASRGKGSLDVIVLTDGEVWQPERTIEFVRKTRTETEGQARFFALGIGNAVSHELVEGIAKAGGGYAEVIPVASTNDWEARMVAVLKAAMTGHVTDINIEVEGVNLQQKGDAGKPPSLQMSPRDTTSMSPFQRNRVLVLSENDQLDKGSEIKIKRTSIKGQRIVTSVPVQLLQERDTTVHKFAAKALLSELDRGASWIQRSGQVHLGSAQERDLTRKEGERLGCQHSLVSKWTSFVAVEEKPRDRESSSLEVAEHPVSIASAELEDYDMDLLMPRARKNLSLSKMISAKLSDDPHMRGISYSPPVPLQNASQALPRTSNHQQSYQGGYQPTLNSHSYYGSPPAQSSRSDFSRNYASQGTMPRASNPTYLPDPRYGDGNGLPDFTRGSAQLNKVQRAARRPALESDNSVARGSPRPRSSSKPSKPQAKRRDPVALDSGSSYEEVVGEGAAPALYSSQAYGMQSRSSQSPEPALCAVKPDPPEGPTTPPPFSPMSLALLKKSGSLVAQTGQSTSLEATLDSNDLTRQASTPSPSKRSRDEDNNTAYFDNSFFEPLFMAAPASQFGMAEGHSQGSGAQSQAPPVSVVTPSALYSPQPRKGDGNKTQSQPHHPLDSASLDSTFLDMSSQPASQTFQSPSHQYESYRCQSAPSYAFALPQAQHFINGADETLDIDMFDFSPYTSDDPRRGGSDNDPAPLESSARDQSPLLQPQDQEAFIRKIISFQRANGVFRMTRADLSNIGPLLQQHFGAVSAPDLQTIVDALTSRGTDVDVAVTAALVAILEAKFRDCQSLWVLMVEKARGYLELHMRDQRPSLLEVAAEMLG